MHNSSSHSRHDAKSIIWILSAYVAEGIPFAMVIWVAGTMFKDFGHQDSDITVSLASIGVIWSLKPLWAGLLDLYKTKKFFVLIAQFIMAILFGCMAMTLYSENYYTGIVILLWLVAFASATQDICIDGIYITALNKKTQAAYIGMQSMAWNFGRIVAVSGAVWSVGYLQNNFGMDTKTSWAVMLAVSGVLYATFGLLHWGILPTGSLPAQEHKASSVGAETNNNPSSHSSNNQTASQVFGKFKESITDFCDRPYLWGMISLVLFYRSSEGLLLVEGPLFMQGCLEHGALQLSLQDKGSIDGTIGTMAVIIGGLVGGLFIARYTLRRTLFILALCINLPNASYIYLAQIVSAENPLSFTHIAAVVGFEKFWYGFGLVGNMLYMMQQLAPGRFRMTHYAFATALMNLILVPTQMISGPMADQLGFSMYFNIAMLAGIPSLLAAWFAPFPHSTVDQPDDDAAAIPQTPPEDAARRLARRATSYALLTLAIFLYIDPLILGSWGLATTATATATLLASLLGTTIAKVILAIIAIRAGRSSLRAAAVHKSRSNHYRNAYGAIVASSIIVCISLGITGAVGYQSSGSSWSCLTSSEATNCAPPPPTTSVQCKQKTIRRSY